MENVAFIYVWIHYTGRYYVGYHTGTTDDGYITSSKIVKPLIQSNPTHWHREIISYGTTEQMIYLEQKLLTTLDARNCDKAYNQHNGNGLFRFKGHTDESKRKLSQAHKGKPAHNKGIPHTTETKKKISEALKKRYGDPKTPQWNKGRKKK